MRSIAKTTSSEGRFIEAGNRLTTSSSSAAKASERGCPTADRSTPARQTLSKVATTAAGIPGKSLIGSSSPMSSSGKTAATVSNSASGSMGRSSPPASRAPS